jgi:peptidyl-prolyl cis-trans isomerase B (cyclophilin B)
MNMSKALVAPFLALALIAFAGEPQDPKPAGLTLTITLDKAKAQVGDDLQAEVKLENTSGKDQEVTALVFEERSVSLHVKATWNGKVKEYDLAVVRPDPHVALRLPLGKVTLANGKSLSLVHRFPALAAGAIEVNAVYGSGADAIKSAAVKSEIGGTSLVAVLDTTSGTIQIDLDHENAPANVSNFVTLAKARFYNDMVFHRVVRGSWVQTGCPYDLGIGGPGYALKAEPSDTALHDEGTVSMSGFDKSGYTGSQFFICLSKLPSLDKRFTIIGKVTTAGLETVKSIGRAEVDKNTDRPKTDIKINKVTVSPK